MILEGLLSQRGDLLRRILSRNGLHQPDGRMLCKYRCTTEEFQAIEADLKCSASNHYSFPQNDLLLGSIFCLYAAEWWRQHYGGGKWTYRGILEAIGKDADMPRQELYGPIRSGLKYWRRSLLTVGDSNAYLVTLSCEAGLPLNLLHSDNDSKFRRYLRGLLREFQVYGGMHASPTDIASRIAYVLPRSLRQAPLYQLCGELIEKVWILQKQIGKSENPLLDLDARLPIWRESFPLVVSDEAAEALLSNLVKEAVTLTRLQEAKVTASLVMSSGRYHLKRTINLPSYFDQKSLAEMLNIEVSDVPFRLQISDCSNDDARMICLISRRVAEGEGKFAVETLTREILERRGQSAFQAVCLQARFGECLVDLNRIKGSMALSSLPWVFVRKGDDGEEDWKMIGEGALKTRSNEALVAIDTAASISMAEGQCEDLGPLDGVDRQLFRFFGRAIIEQDGVQFDIVTSASDDDSSHFLIYGTFLHSGMRQTQIYRGLPKVQRCFEGGGAIQLKPEQLEWKPRGTSAPWKVFSEQCAGPVQVRFAPGGQIHFIADVDIVPATSVIRFEPGHNNRCGAIELRGFGLEDCGLECPSGVGAKRQDIDGGFRFELSCTEQPPASIPFYLLWSGRREIRLDVSYPARGVRFIGRDGRVLNSDEKVHVSQLGGVLVQVMEPERHHVKYLIEASVLSRQINYASYQLKSEGPYLAEVAPGRHEFDLRTLEERCRLLFSGTKDLDAWIRVGVLSSTGDQFPQKIYIARYDLTLQPDKQTGEVSVPEEERVSTSELVSKIQIKVFPLGCPEVEEMETLDSTSEGVWQFAPDRRTKGPWLLTGWSGEWSRTRPLCWTVQGDEAIRGAESPESLEGCVSIADYQERKDQIDKVLQKLKFAPGHEDWKKIFAYFNLTRHLPAPTFDVLVRAAKNPEIAAACLINASEEVFDDVWTGLERLPFVWALVPVKHWLQAAKIKQEYLSGIYHEVAGILHQPVESLIERDFQEFFNQSQLRFSGIKPVAQLIASSVLSVPLSSTELAPMTSGAFRNVLVAHGIADPAQTLMQIHAEDYWPELPGLLENWWPKYAPQVPEELHSLWRITQNSGYRASILNAPIAAALSAAFNLYMNKYFRFNIRRLRDFDRNWFDSAYGCALACCIGFRFEHGMSYDDE